MYVWMWIYACLHVCIMYACLYIVDSLLWVTKALFNTNYKK